MPLTGSLADGRLPGVKHKLTLPLLPRILAAGHAHGSGTYLIYSNLDIALQVTCPPQHVTMRTWPRARDLISRISLQLDAYVLLASLLERQPYTPISAIREEYEHAPPTFSLDDAAALRGRGLPHPGHDLWAFRREWVPALRVGDVALGVSLVATALNQARAVP